MGVAVEGACWPGGGGTHLQSQHSRGRDRQIFVVSLKLALSTE